MDEDFTEPITSDSELDSDAKKFVDGSTSNAEYVTKLKEFWMHCVGSCNTRFQLSSTSLYTERPSFEALNRRLNNKEAMKYVKEISDTSNSLKDASCSESNTPFAGTDKCIESQLEISGISCSLGQANDISNIALCTSSPLTPSRCNTHNKLTHNTSDDELQQVSPIVPILKQRKSDPNIEIVAISNRPTSSTLRSVSFAGNGRSSFEKRDNYNGSDPSKKYPATICDLSRSSSGYASQTSAAYNSLSSNNLSESGDPIIMKQCNYETTGCDKTDVNIEVNAETSCSQDTVNNTNSEEQFVVFNRISEDKTQFNLDVQAHPNYVENIQFNLDVHANSNDLDNKFIASSTEKQHLVSIHVNNNDKLDPYNTHEDAHLTNEKCMRKCKYEDNILCKRDTKIQNPSVLLSQNSDNDNASVRTLEPETYDCKTNSTNQNISVLPDFEALGVSDAFVSEREEILPCRLEATEYENKLELLRNICAEMISRGCDIAYMEERLEESVLSDWNIIRPFAFRVIASPMTVTVAEREDQEKSLIEDLELDSPDDDYWSEDDKANIINILHMAVCCKDASCQHEDCRKGKTLLFELERRVKDLDIVSSRLHTRVLYCIIEHAFDCERLRCRVPWCEFFFRLIEGRPTHDKEDDPEDDDVIPKLDDINPQRMVAALLKFYKEQDSQQDVSEAPQDINEENFVQLETGVDWPSAIHNYLPREGIDYKVQATPIGRFGDVEKIALSVTLPPIYLKVTQSAGVVEGSHTMWARMRDLKWQHLCIVRNLWVDLRDKKVTPCIDCNTCSDDNLEEYILNQRPLRWEEIWLHSRNLLSAVIYLHDIDVIYMLWTAARISIDARRKAVRLYDFSFSVALSTLVGDADRIEMLRSSLPPNIISPEMFDDNVGTYTDVWGFGCVLYHMITGRAVHEHLVHEPLEVALSRVQTFEPDALLQSDIPRNYLDIFQCVFIDYANRASANSLRMTILSRDQ